MNRYEVLRVDTCFLTGETIHFEHEFEKVEDVNLFIYILLLSESDRLKSKGDVDFYIRVIDNKYDSFYNIDPIEFLDNMEKSKVGDNWNIGYKITDNLFDCKSDSIYEIGSGIEIYKDLAKSLGKHNNMNGDKKYFKVKYSSKNIINGFDKIIATKIKIIEEIDILKYIEKFKDEVDWDSIMLYQRLSEDFVRKFKDYIDWNWIFAHQNLSMSLAKEFKSYIDWEYVSKEVKFSDRGGLSIDFVREFKDCINWRDASYKNLPENFRREFRNELNWMNMDNKQYKD